MNETTNERTTMSKQAEDAMTMDEDDLPHPADMRYGKPAPDARKAATVIRDLLEFCVMDDLIRDWKAENGDEMDGVLSWAICLREQARDAIRDLEGEA